MREEKIKFSDRVGRGLDSAISIVAPRTALKRRAARMGMNYLSNAFKGADRGRQRSSWLPGGSSADQALLRDLPTLRERSRDLNRNNAHASGITQTMQTNIISTGIRPQSHIPHKVVGISEERARELQDIAEYEFDLWTQTADAGGRMSFYDMQDLVCRQILESGESLLLPVNIKRPGSAYPFALQAIEADRLDTPGEARNDRDVRKGVKIGRFGQPVSYFLRDTHPGDYQYGTRAKRFREIPAYDRYGRKNLYHLYFVDRPGQSRGMPFFAPVLTYFKDLGEYGDAELMAARISACFAMIIETESSIEEDPIGGTAPVLSGDKYLEDDIAPGMVKRTYPGEKFNSFNPSRPSDKFEPFVLWILRSISASLGMPYELVSKDFSRTNYSSARAGLLQAYKFFKRRQYWFASHLCQPTYVTVLEHTYLAGKFGDIPFYEFLPYFTNAVWMPDGWEWVDPVKEARAEDMALKNQTATLSEVYAKKGMDWEEALEQIAKEKKKMDELGLKIETKEENSPVISEEDKEDEKDDEKDEEDEDAVPEK